MAKKANKKQIFDEQKESARHKRQEQAWKEIKDIANKAVEKHGDFNSLHEAYAVILEEVDELWDETRKKQPDWKNVKIELMQIAAMTLKGLDLCSKK